MEGTETKEQPTDQKVQWASLSDEEDEEGQKHENKPKQAAKKSQQKKKNPAVTKPTKASNNIFVCDDLDAGDDEDEVEQPVKKDKKAEGPSMRDFVANTNNEEKKPVEQAPLSKKDKKDQKKKELEEFDKALQEFKLTAPAGAEPAAETGKAEGETVEVDASKATEKENNEDAEKKKKKKKKAEKKEGEKAEAEAKPAEEKKEAETQPAGPVDVEKRIQEIMKNKAKQQQTQQKKTGPNLDAAKQEILARQQKKTSKKKYEDL